jgi:cytochrome c peroxidase
MQRAVVLTLLALCACTEDVPARGWDLPWQAQPLTAAAEPADNPSSPAKRLLGRALFYDPLLSADRATACVTCHSELWGLGDQLARSVGVGGRGAIGPGREGPHMTRRNAPALWNLSQRSAFFWDGRADSLEAQIFFPLENQDELARDPDALIAELAANSGYAELFQAAFPDVAQPISRDTLAKALASFMRGYVSDRAPYDQFLAGDELALDAADRKGLDLFAELDCQSCHVPPRFESDSYADRAVPNPEAIADDGRGELPEHARERGRFRVPTLRNVRETGPYFHNGAVASLEEAVQHEVDRQLERTARAQLTAAEMRDLVGFLRRALTDTTREQHPPSSLPSGLTPPLDNERILRGSREP